MERVRRIYEVMTEPDAWHARDLGPASKALKDLRGDDGRDAVDDAAPEWKRSEDLRGDDGQSPDLATER